MLSSTGQRGLLVYQLLTVMIPHGPPKPPDALQPLQQPTWLVVRNMHCRPLQSRELAPGTDLRAILQADTAERFASGWGCTDIGRACSDFFAARRGERMQIGIERYDPEGPGHQSHCELAPAAAQEARALKPHRPK